MIKCCTRGFIYIFFFLVTVPAYGAEIDSYSEFADFYKDAAKDEVLDLQQDLEAFENLGTTRKSDINIQGNNHTINGNNFAGMQLDYANRLNVESLNAQNFKNTNGAVVFNNDSSVIDNFTGNFSNNHATLDGGVIFNNASVNNISGTFTGNHADYNGGAIYNNLNHNIENLEGNFFENYVDNNAGGAIMNLGNISNLKGNFQGNRADNGSGGAIYNGGDIKNLNGNFDGNYSGASGFAGGGALYNYGVIEKASGKFTNNSTAGEGGAIYNIFGVINFVSDEGEVEFTGNKDSTGSNAIYNDSAVINFNAGDYDIVINDKINGNNSFSAPEININPDNGDFPVYGNVIINNEVSDNTVNMYNGVLKFGHNIQDENEYFGNFSDSTDFNFYGGAVDLRNDNIQNTNFGNLTLYNDMEVMLDGSCDNMHTDTFSADTFNSNDHHINICDINLMSPTTLPRFSFCPIGENTSEDVRKQLCESIDYTGGDVVDSPIYKYRTYFDHETGLINFVRIEDEDKFSSAVLTSPIAAQLGGYLVQLNSYDTAFRNMDMYMITPGRQKSAIPDNRYASASANIPYNPAFAMYASKYGWIKPYSIFENVPLKKAPRVSNVGYGTFFGVESELIRLKRGWNLIWGPYAGYNGSHQAFNNAGIYQNGGTIGVVSMAYKNKRFAGLTVNASAAGCEGNNKFGNENFAMFMAGIAAKAGYNQDFYEGRFLVQPNLMVSYTFVNTFDYKNSSGVNINSDALNAIQVAPGVKFIGNFNKGWQPYASVNVVWNILDKAKFFANDVALPQLSVKPFVIYGVGLRKIVDEKFSGYTEAFVTNGGRNGVGLQFGFRLQI